MGQLLSEVWCDSGRHPQKGLASFQPLPLIPPCFSFSMIGDTVVSGRSLLEELKCFPLDSNLCWVTLIPQL